MRIGEVIQRAALQDPLLELGVRHHRRRDEGGRADRQEVLGVRLVVQQLGSRHAHHLDRHADEADIVDVARPVGAWTGKPHIRPIAARFGEHAAPHVRGQVVADRHGGAHHAVRLGVAGTLVVSRLPMLTHIRGHRIDDGLQRRVLAGQRPLFGELQPLVPALAVDQVLDQVGHRLAQHRIDGWTEERFEPPLHMQSEHDGIVQCLPETRHRTSPQRHVVRSRKPDSDGESKTK